MAAGSTDSTGSRDSTGAGGTGGRQSAEGAGSTDGARRAAAVLGTAARLAAEVLAPAAMSVEATRRVPAFAPGPAGRRGLLRNGRPAYAGGLDLARSPTACRVVEVLASGCLSTAFVWLQHHGAVRAAAAAPAPAAGRAARPAVPR